MPCGGPHSGALVASHGAVTVQISVVVAFLSMALPINNDLDTNEHVGAVIDFELCFDAFHGGSSELSLFEVPTSLPGARVSIHDRPVLHSALR